VPIHQVTAAKVKTATQSVSGNVLRLSAIKYVNQSVNSHVAPLAAKSLDAASVPSSATNLNAKCVAPSSIAKKVPAQNVILSAKNQHATPSAQTPPLLANQSAKNHFAIGNVTAQQIAKSPSAPLSAKNLLTANHRPHPPIAARAMLRKKMRPKMQNVADARKVETPHPLPMLQVMVHLLDAKPWNYSAPATVPPKPMQKRHLAKPRAHNLHHFASSVVVRCFPKKKG
jgi:hypothetical protein